MIERWLKNRQRVGTKRHRHSWIRRGDRIDIAWRQARKWRRKRVLVRRPVSVLVHPCTVLKNKRRRRRVDRDRPAHQRARVIHAPIIDREPIGAVNLAAVQIGQRIERLIGTAAVWCAACQDRFSRQIRERGADEILAVIAGLGVERRAVAVGSRQRDRQGTVSFAVEREVDGDSRDVCVDVVGIVNRDRRRRDVVAGVRPSRT